MEFLFLGIFFSSYFLLLLFLFLFVEECVGHTRRTYEGGTLSDETIIIIHGFSTNFINFFFLSVFLSSLSELILKSYTFLLNSLWKCNLQLFFFLIISDEILSNFVIRLGNNTYTNY